MESDDDDKVSFDINDEKFEEFEDGSILWGGKRYPSRDYLVALKVNKQIQHRRLRKRRKIEFSDSEDDYSDEDYKESKKKRRYYNPPCPGFENAFYALGKYYYSYMISLRPYSINSMNAFSIICLYFQKFMK
jgi:hypothetical protein